MNGKETVDEMVGRLLREQANLDETTRQMAHEIVEAQDPKTLGASKQFAENWIATAAQYARNEEYWRERAKAAEIALCDMVDLVGSGWPPETTAKIYKARDIASACRTTR